MAAEQQVIPSTINMRMMVVDETGQWVPLKSTNDGLNVTNVNDRPLAVEDGGTGVSSFTDGAFVIGNGSGSLDVVGPGTAGQIPISQGAGNNPTMTTLSGDATMTSGGVVTVASATGSFALLGDISPSISAAQNDWSPTGLSTASRIYVTATGAGRSITGLSGGAAGRVITLVNAGSLFITLENEDAGSSAANRFSLGSTDISLWTGDSVVLVYDENASRWRCVAERIDRARFAAYLAADETGIATGTIEPINIATESFDSHGWYDTSTYRYTPLLPGKYLFTWAATISSLAATAVCISFLYKNGASVARGSQVVNGGTGDNISVGSYLVDMNGSTDYVDLRVFHNHGSNRDIKGGTEYTRLSGERVGA